MDANVSADSGNNKNPFFKTPWNISPAALFCNDGAFSVIASRTAAQRPSVSATPATELLHADGVRNNGSYVIAKQQGAVLITGLIFLVILMLIGTTAMQGTLLEERMAGNLRDETLAFQAAEAALRSGERFLEQVTIPEFNGSDGLYYYADCWSDPDADDTTGGTGNACAPADPAKWSASDWSDETKTRLVEIETDGVASQPRYFIEQLPGISLMGNSGSAQQSGSLQTASIFRIVAHGVGGNNTTIAILQSTYQR